MAAADDRTREIVAPRVEQKPETYRGPWTPVKDLLIELTANSIKVVLEACFLIIWALVVWGISAALHQIEPDMPIWARTLFTYVEIGFAVYLLAEMFLKRADVFERAVGRARDLLRNLRA